jgi:MscS family membrane protein
MRFRALPHLALSVLVWAGWLFVPAGQAAEQETSRSGRSSATTTVQDERPPEGTSQGMPPFSRLGAQAVALWENNTFWNWCSPLIGLVLAVLVGRILAAILRRYSDRFRRRGWRAQEQAIRGLIGPASLVLITLGLSLGMGNVTLGGLRDFWGKTTILLYTIAFLWYASNLVALVEIGLRRLIARTESPVDDHLAPWIRRILRALLWTLGILFVVNTVFEQDIGAWLAGLGIAGLAVSLAAQDSLKNLFGSLTILMDRPFRVGERIVFGGYDGVIEEIGFRSTKVRTLTGHLVTVPNANIVNEAVENIGRRPAIRRVLNVTITYDTPADKVREAVTIIRDILEQEDLRGPIHQTVGGNESPPRVYFNDYNAESLNIFVIYWYVPPSYWDYLEHAEKVNLRIFEEFEKAGIEFAFPTQTLYLASDPKRKLTLEMLGRDLDSRG